LNRQKFRILFVIILILVCIINLAGLSFGTDNRQGSFDGFFFSLSKTGPTALCFAEDEARRSVLGIIAYVGLAAFMAFALAAWATKSDYRRLFFSDLRREIREALSNRYHGSKFK